MSFDGIVTRAVAHELKKTIITGRITKIYQPFQHDLLLQIRINGKKQQLLLSANPSYARIHLTEETYENPPEPPMFCMLLRKHLEGGVIEKIEQLEMDRILMMTVKARNEIGDYSYKKLIIEIMGRHSNILLIDIEKGIILDSIKHVSPAVNRHRTIMPGREYVEPPKQHKLNPFLADQETILKKLDFNSGRLSKQIVSSFAGISPLAADEIIHRAGLANRTSVPSSFIEFFTQLEEHQYHPQIIRSSNRETFYITELAHLSGEKKSFHTVSHMLDRFYYRKADRDRVKQQANDLERLIKNEINKNKKKIKKLTNTLEDSEKAAQFQLYGELITANIYAIKRGDSEAEVENYYDENHMRITIPLHPQKTPAENAQAYYTKYQKAKNSIAIVTEQLEKTKAEIDYLENLNMQIQTAAPKDIHEIREELEEEGYLKKKRTKVNRKANNQKPTLERYVADDGTEILVGKNNKQNEYLTNRVASKEDVWLHTKDIPGSHVVIRNGNPSEETIHAAAVLAAFYSKARSSSSVPVDFTKIKHVKKPNGAKPGYVIYDNQQTVYVTPDEDAVFQLKK